MKELTRPERRRMTRMIRKRYGKDAARMATCHKCLSPVPINEMVFIDGFSAHRVCPD